MTDALTPAFGSFQDPLYLRLIEKLYGKNNPGWMVRQRRKYIEKFRSRRLNPVDIAALGLRWRLFPSSNHSERVLWCTRKFAETASFDALSKRLAGKTTLFFDIGANCGCYTLPFAATLSENSRIVAFEPNPKMARRLRVNLGFNNLGSRVDLHQVALGATSGSVEMGIHRKNLGMSAIGLTAAKTRKYVTVQLRQLAGFVADLKRPEIFAIKIDVEGAEPDCLIPFFRDCAPEFWPDLLLIEIAHADEWQQDLLQTLNDCGYVQKQTSNGNALYERKPGKS